MQKPYPIYDDKWPKSIPCLWSIRLKNHTLWGTLPRPRVYTLSAERRARPIHMAVPLPPSAGWLIRYLILSRRGMVRIVKEIIKIIPEPLKSHETSRNRSGGEHYNRRKYFTLAKTVVKKNNYNLRSLNEFILPSLKSNSLCLPPIISCNSHTSVWKCSLNYQAKEGKSAFSLTAWKLGRGRTKCFARWVAQPHTIRSCKLDNVTMPMHQSQPNIILSPK